MVTIKKLLRDSEVFRAGDIQMGHVVAKLIQALRCKPEVRGFNNLWCHWNFSLKK
jgi:hypothetical protein